MATVPTSDLQVQALLEQIAASGQPIAIGGEFSISAVQTGIASFDLSTGIGGLPRGRVVIMQGEEASGKTLLSLVTIASVQKAGGRAAFVDLEHALTPSFAQLLGVDYDALVVSRPKTLNDAYDVTKPLVQSGLFDIVVFDSAVALSTKDAISKSASDGSQRASEAQVHSQELKKVVSSIDDRTVLVIINQMRENPNPPNWWRGGKMLYSPGGRGLRHASSMTVDVSVGEKYEKNKVRIGQRTRTYISKNKVGTPFRRAEFDLMYATGLDLTTSLVDTCVSVGIIRQSGSFYYFDLYDLDSGEVAKEYKWNGRAKLDEAVAEEEVLGEALNLYLAQYNAAQGEEETE